MRPAPYPFAAIVGQPEMKLALLLAAVDWRLGVLLRGEKGSGKTTTARALAALLPAPAPFINLPLGVTEDRLLGGLDLERALKGEPALKAGLLSEAHGGVLYIDEVNLLAPHLGDALLDSAASGINVVEREGLSESHAAEFVLLGSMNPEEGSLRPQLLDRFALSVEIAAPEDAAERCEVVERRLRFEHEPLDFAEHWKKDQKQLQMQIARARALKAIVCGPEILLHVSQAICDQGVRSMRADLAAVRAAIACAALAGDSAVTLAHVEAVLPLVLAHRMRERSRKSPPSAPPPQAQPQTKQDAKENGDTRGEAQERIFAPQDIETPAVGMMPQAKVQGAHTSTESGLRGPVTGTRRTETPAELDLNATLRQALRETGSLQPRAGDLHERIRAPRGGTRYLLLIDSSGSHAARERMRLAKGAAAAMLTRSFRRGDEVALILFRGTSAQVLLAPTGTLADALAALEYLPTGGRTPLAHALELAQELATAETLLILLTDGHANVASHGGDPWMEALAAARLLRCTALVVDTETAAEPTGQTHALAEAMQARYVTIHDLSGLERLRLEAGPGEVRIASVQF